MKADPLNFIANVLAKLREHLKEDPADQGTLDAIRMAKKNLRAIREMRREIERQRALRVVVMPSDN